MQAQKLTTYIAAVAGSVEIIRTSLLFRAVVAEFPEIKVVAMTKDACLAEVEDQIINAIQARIAVGRELPTIGIMQPPDFSRDGYLKTDASWKLLRERREGQRPKQPTRRVKQQRRESQD